MDTGCTGVRTARRTPAFDEADDHSGMCCQKVFQHINTSYLETEYVSCTQASYFKVSETNDGNKQESRVFLSLFALFWTH